MRIISERKHVTVATYYHRFNDAVYGAGRFQGGYAFEVDENGRYLGNAARDPLYRAALSGQVGNRPLVDLGITRYEHYHSEPAIGLCGECGQEVTLSGFTNSCKCGIDYDMSGQELAPREQWGEETGESVADILAADRDD